MIVPVRCFSCGSVIGGAYEKFKERVSKGEDGEKVLDDLHIKKYCCRRMLFSHVDFIDEIMIYKSLK
ncbi:MAG: DNA-directed RNA polymerase subunit N [Candidatus Diapherotrites archaeon]|uniref:DNA-directed RNA polymerase subunit Rpo10 n=1 Tax=Candidatus Iainarchaeum sp. TaxID=3101447 RepID=A0A8T3YMU2_9ARCH|nr:DNA-directed RNA polymerase subunit N [Candidatus Diapherotrites archaeon]